MCENCSCPSCLHRRPQLPSDFDGDAEMVCNIPLTKAEWRLVAYFASKLNRMCAHEQIDAALATLDGGPSRDTISVMISHINKKLRPTPFRIKNKHGFGYAMHCN